MQFTQETTVYPAESVDSKMEYVDLGAFTLASGKSILVIPGMAIPEGTKFISIMPMTTTSPTPTMTGFLQFMPFGLTGDFSFRVINQYANNLEVNLYAMCFK